jgi:CRP-like cAMP-binding protein
MVGYSINTVEEAKVMAAIWRRKALEGKFKMGFLADLFMKPIPSNLTTIEEAEAYAICVKAYEEAKAIAANAGKPEFHNHQHVHLHVDSGEKQEEFEIDPTKVHKLSFEQRKLLKKMSQGVLEYKHQ